jgi:nucleoid-associated protein YgaU
VRRDRVDVARVLASIVAIVVLVAVLPFGLIAVARARFDSGNPLAGIGRAWFGDDAAATLARPIADDTVVDGLIRLSLCAAWVAIAVIAITTVFEVAHMIRHRGLPMPSVRGMGWAQGIARFIAVGLIVLIPVSTPTPSIATALSGRVTGTGSSITAQMPVATTLIDTRADLAEPPTNDVTTDAPAPEATHVVRPGESVYSIAEGLAGTNARPVLDIADAIVDANLGATMGPGQRFTNPAYLEVGWVLQIPAGLVTAPVDRPAEIAPNGETGVYTVQRGDTLWDIADEQLGDPTAWPEIWADNAGHDMGGGHTFDDPDLILPGWELDVSGDDQAESASAPTDVAPVVAAPAPADVESIATEPPPAATTPVSTVSPILTNVIPGSTSTSTTSPSTTSTIPTAELGGDTAGVADLSAEAPGAPSPLRMEHAALLAAGVLALVGVRRRQRLRAAMPRHRVPEPRPEAVETERRLRAVDAGERALRVDVACRAAAWSLIGTGAQIGWIEVTPEGDVGLRLSAPAGLPAPWAGADQDWRLAAGVPVELLSAGARQVGMPCVALAQLGVTATGADLLIDVEACGTLAIEAPPDQAEDVVTALAAGLASSMYAEVAHLIGVGLPSAALLGHRNGHVAESADSAMELARALVGTTVDNERTSFELRSLRTGGEMWEPAVILIGGGEMPDGDELPIGGHGIGLVVPVAPGELRHAATRLVGATHSWSLTGFGSAIDLTPVGLSHEDLVAIDAVLAEADSELQSIELDDVRWADDVHEQLEDSGPPDVASEFVPMTHRIVVGLLGGIEITDDEGNQGRFERSKTVELIAWLATHRDRATRTGARTALWELDVRDATFANVVSEARRGLARLVAPADGEEWVARTLTEQLPLHDAVVTDADLVDERLARARVQPPSQALVTLRPAVELIRDMPFAGTSYLWPDAEGITSNLVLLAITAAAEFAGHALSLGDTEGVFWATGRGLQVLPGHEELIGLRMRAHAHAGDLAGVRQEWESYERVLVADAWSDGEPAPKLLALRRELLSPKAT